MAAISAAAQYAAATIYGRRVKEAWLAKAATTPQYPQARQLLTPPPPLTTPLQSQHLPASYHGVALQQQQVAMPSIFEAKAPATAAPTLGSASVHANTKPILKRSPSGGSTGKVREESGQLRQVSTDASRCAALVPISGRLSLEVLQDIEKKKALEANRRKTAKYWSGLVSKLFENMDSTGSDSPPPNASPEESAEDTLFQQASKAEDGEVADEEETAIDKQEKNRRKVIKRHREHSGIRD